MSSPKVQWKLRWENDLELSDHLELAEFFKATYGPTGPFNAKPFSGGRSWAGARLELRAIAYDSQGIAAHMGALRRFIKVNSADVLVAELGLYGVRPDLEGFGISHSIRAMYPVLQELRIPFAFGTVRHELKTHFSRLCRHGLGTIIEGIRVRSTLSNVHLDLPSTRVEDVLVVVMPINSSLQEWPSGETIERNGPEL
uniref:Nodulation protein A n=2 Tax=Cupriavidus TaxID=106589 RepID=Q70YB4_9BURK|nr:acyltransferase [Cupriavidus taiwanensis LMG 19424]